MGLTTRIAGKLTNYEDPNSLGSKFRIRRMGLLIKLVKAVGERHGRVDIIDIGGTRTYWNIFPQHTIRDSKVTVTILNLPGSNLPADEEHYRYVEGDACDLSLYEDKAFHIAHSNSVIEHVGGWGQMMRFATEARRVARNYFVQTPNFWFPIEPHFMVPLYHWLPVPIRVRLIMNFDLGHHRRATTVDEAVRIVESARLLNLGMVRELFPDAHIVKEKFAFLTKSLVAVKGGGYVV